MYNQARKIFHINAAASWGHARAQPGWASCIHAIWTAPNICGIERRGVAGPAVAASDDAPTARVSRVALSRARLQYEALRLTAEGRAAAAAEPGLGLGPVEAESVSQVRGTPRRLLAAAILPRHNVFVLGTFLPLRFGLSLLSGPQTV